MSKRGCRGADLAEVLSRRVPAGINPTAYALIGVFCAAKVDRYRDRTAYLCMGLTMTYGALDRLSRAFESYLRSDC